MHSIFLEYCPLLLRSHPFSHHFPSFVQVKALINFETSTWPTPCYSPLHSSPHLALLQPETVFLWQAHGTQGINHRTSKIQILMRAARNLSERISAGVCTKADWMKEYLPVWSTLPGMKATQNIAQPRLETKTQQQDLNPPLQVPLKLTLLANFSES